MQPPVGSLRGGSARPDGLSRYLMAASRNMAQRMLDAYRVVEVRSADGSQPAPPEIAERFDGRLFTLRQLEERGVRITGKGAWYLAAGRDWQLKLEPTV
jgi:hypothetical protein